MVGGIRQGVERAVPAAPARCYPPCGCHHTPGWIATPRNGRSAAVGPLLPRCSGGGRPLLHRRLEAVGRRRLVVVKQSISISERSTSARSAVFVVHFVVISVFAGHSSAARWRKRKRDDAQRRSATAPPRSAPRSCGQTPRQTWHGGGQALGCGPPPVRPPNCPERCPAGVSPFIVISLPSSATASGWPPVTFALCARRCTARNIRYCRSSFCAAGGANCAGKRAGGGAFVDTCSSRSRAGKHRSCFNPVGWRRLVISRRPPLLAILASRS